MKRSVVSSLEGDHQGLPVVRDVLQLVVRVQNASCLRTKVPYYHP
jgi:hypothetical protein